jgi:hypothetical protein
VEASIGGETRGGPRLVDVCVGEPRLGDHRVDRPHRALAAVPRHEAPPGIGDAVPRGRHQHQGRVASVPGRDPGRPGPARRAAVVWLRLGPARLASAVAVVGLCCRVGLRRGPGCHLGHPVRRRGWAVPPRQPRLRGIQRALQLLPAADRGCDRARRALQSGFRLRVRRWRPAARREPVAACGAQRRRYREGHRRTDLLRLRWIVVGRLWTVVRAPPGSRDGHGQWRGSRHDRHGPVDPRSAPHPPVPARLPAVLRRHLGRHRVVVDVHHPRVVRRKRVASIDLPVRPDPAHPGDRARRCRRVWHTRLAGRDEAGPPGQFGDLVRSRPLRLRRSALQRGGCGRGRCHRDRPGWVTGTGSFGVVAVGPGRSGSRVLRHLRGGQRRHRLGRSAAVHGRRQRDRVLPGGDPLPGRSARSRCGRAARHRPRRRGPGAVGGGGGGGGGRRGARPPPAPPPPPPATELSRRTSRCA